ncbi:hypothetical protein GCM10010425_22740 [Streptomyces spororaveus]
MPRREAGRQAPNTTDTPSPPYLPDAFAAHPRTLTALHAAALADRAVYQQKGMSA